MNSIRVHVNDAEVIWNGTLLIPKGQSARINLGPEFDNLDTQIQFVDVPSSDPETPPEKAINIKGEGTEGSIVFTNWNNTRAGTEAPIEYATDDKGRTITFVAMARLMRGQIYEVFVQFMRSAGK